MNTVTRIALTALAALSVATAASAKSPILKEIEDAFVQLHAKVSPSVVNIETESAAQMDNSMEEFYRMFGMPVPDPNGNPGLPPNGGPHQQMPPMPRAQATGSGFIYSADGYIVTNNHVVENAEKITVRLSDGKEYQAEVVGVDADTDLAVIKIEADVPLIPVVLGDSDTLQVGQFAVAMGSPRGFEGSFSFGHISALGREDMAALRQQGLRFQNLIQTDAAINLGNSGGPLTNIDGEVVGINVAIIWGANSLGFAIPSNTAKHVVPVLIAQGKVVRGYLGVQIKNASEFAQTDVIGLPDTKGAFVTMVVPDTPAANAGVQAYDVIRKVDDHEVENANALVRIISSYPPDAKVKLEVWRDKQALVLDTQLAEWDAPSDGRHAGGSPQSNNVMGMTFRALTPDMVESLGLEVGTTGVVLLEIESGSPAEQAGLMQGDVILEVGREAVTDANAFRELINKHGQPGTSFLVRYIRGSGAADISVIEVPKEKAN